MKIDNSIASQIASESKIVKDDKKTYVSKEVLEQAKALNSKDKVSIIVDSKIIALKETSIKSLVKDFNKDISLKDGVLVVKDGAKDYLKKIINNLSHREHSVLINDMLDVHINKDSKRDGILSPSELLAKKIYNEKTLIENAVKHEKTDWAEFFRPFYEEMSKLQGHLQRLSKEIPKVSGEKKELLIKEFSDLSLSVQSKTAQVLQLLKSSEIDVKVPNINKDATDDTFKIDNTAIASVKEPTINIVKSAPKSPKSDN